MLSNVLTGVAPGLTLKAWVLFDATGAIKKSYNVSGVVRNSVGSFTVTFTSAMATTAYVMDAVMMIYNGLTAHGFAACNAVAVGSCTVVTVAGGGLVDPGGCYVAFYE